MGYSPKVSLKCKETNGKGEINEIKLVNTFKSQEWLNTQIIGTDLKYIECFMKKGVT
jgi:hypothetical protein